MLELRWGNGLRHNILHHANKMVCTCTQLLYCRWCSGWDIIRLVTCESSNLTFPVKSREIKVIDLGTIRASFNVCCSFILFFDFLNFLLRCFILLTISKRKLMAKLTDIFASGLSSWVSTTKPTLGASDFRIRILLFVFRLDSIFLRVRHVIRARLLLLFIFFSNLFLFHLLVKGSSVWF